MASPPQIGKLNLPYKYWTIAVVAGEKYHVDPCKIVAVMAIESRYKQYARNKRCKSYGLMQIQIDVSKKYGVKNIYDPRENIECGAKILAHLLDVTNGNFKRALDIYNPECKYGNHAYCREVIKAYKQAKRSMINEGRLRL